MRQNSSNSNINPTSTLIREVMMGEIEAINAYIAELRVIQSKELWIIIEEILMDEVKHYNWLIEILRQIDTEQGKTYKMIEKIDIPSYSSLQEKNNNMGYDFNIDEALRDNIKDELDAINGYEERFLKISNKGIRDVLSKIMADEKDHLEILTKAVKIK